MQMKKKKNQEIMYTGQLKSDKKNQHKLFICVGVDFLLELV